MSDKTLVQKLLIKENYKVIIINEPENYRTLLGELPENVSLLTEPDKTGDIFQVFVSSKKELAEKLILIKPAINPKASLWITYPKGSSKFKTDINRDIIREYASSIGLKSVAMISVDDTWAALRLRLIV